jgi:hypothetical protein
MRNIRSWKYEKAAIAALELCSYLGIPIAPEKTFGPSSILSFAGIELVPFTWRLAYRLTKCCGAITCFHNFSSEKRPCPTLKELQSLIGLLNFTCSVVVPGRAFIESTVPSRGRIGLYTVSTAFLRGLDEPTPKKKKTHALFYLIS